MNVQDWSDAGRTFTHAGHPIFYRDEGAGAALLLLHGFPTSSWDWKKVWPGLRASWRVIAPDLIGFGLSAKPLGHGYSIFDQADLAENLLRELGITRAHVLAHDYGDTVAQELLARQHLGLLSFRMESLCLLNGGIVPSAHRPRLIQRLLNSPLGRMIGMLMNEKSFRRSFAPIFGPGTPPSEEELLGFWHFMQHNHGTRISHKLIGYIPERKQHAQRWVTPLLNPGIPLQLIFGARDPISGQHMVDALRALGPDPHVGIEVLPEIGHYPQTEAPERVLSTYLAFREALAG